MNRHGIVQSGGDPPKSTVDHRMRLSVIHTTIMSTSTIYCQTCSSQLTPPALKLAFIPPCCRIPICAPCIAHNPRLSEYSPCLRCGDLTTREGESKVIRGRRAQEWKEADREGGQLMFDAEGDEVDDLEMGPGEGGDSIDKTEKTSDPAADTKVGGAALNAEEVETVEVKHPVTRGDTLIAIARRYATDASTRQTVRICVHADITKATRATRTQQSTTDSLIFQSSYPPNPEINHHITSSDPQISALRA